MRITLAALTCSACFGLAVDACFGSEMDGIRSDWAQLESRSRPSHVGMRSRVAVDGKPDIIEERHEVWTSNDGWLNHHEQTGGTSATTRLSLGGANSDYSFSVLAQDKSRYALQGLTLRDATSSQSLDEARERAQAGDHLLRLSPFDPSPQFSLLALQDVAKHPSLRWEVSQEGDLAKLRIHGQLKSGPDWLSLPAKIDSHVVLDKKHWHVIREADTVVHDAQGRRARWRVVNDVRMEQGVPVPRRATFEEQPLGSDLTLRGTIEFDAFDFDTKLDPRKIRLAYYGIPEPSRAYAPGSYRLPTWLYLVIGGVLAIVAGFGILYLNGRSKR